MTEKLISIHSLSKEFLVNKNKTCILKNINFSIVKGDIFLYLVYPDQVNLHF